MKRSNSYGSAVMKPSAPFLKTRFPRTDCFFHSGYGGGHGYSSPDENSWEFRKFNNLGRQFLLESARERAKEMAVFAVIIVVAAWPVIYMIVSVVQLLLKGRPLDR
jgi:hypothetical protein